MTAIPAQVEEIADSGVSPFTQGPKNGKRVTEGALLCLADPKKRSFLAAFAACAIVLDGCEAAGVCRRTVDNWRTADALFCKLFNDAKEDGADRLERHALAMARDAKRPNPILTIFMLKGMRPLKYRDNVAISGHDGGPLFRMVAGVSPQRVCGTEQPKLTASNAKALLESDATKAAVKPVEPVKS